MITIKRAGNLLEISDPALSSLLDESLSFYQRTAYYGKELLERYEYKNNNPADTSFNPQYSFVKRLMYQIKDGKLYAAAGLKTRVCAVLAARGIKYNFIDLRSKKLPQAEWDRLLDFKNLVFRYKQDQVLATIDSAEGGIIVAPPGYGKTRIIELLLKVYPKARILVVSPGLDLLKSTYDRLLAVTPDIGRIGGGKYEPDPRVTLCSADSLHRAYIEKADIIIYDEVHTAGTDARIRDLSRFTEAKFIGFSASFPGRSDGADDLVESIFGPVLLRIDYTDAAEHKAVVPIKVLMINIPPEPGVEYNIKSQVAWKRAVLWRNAHRNKLLAKALEKIPQWLNQPDTQILVMCETLDHCYELRKYAPEYKLVYATKSEDRHKQLVRRKLAEADEDELTAKARQQARKDFEDGKLRKVIATMVWKQGVNFVNLQVLVRADAGATEINSIQIPGRLSRTTDGKEFGLLIDAYDRHDPKAYRRALERKRSYSDMGWDIKIVYNLDEPMDLTK
jgi:superfamily II DNA or RNA helicase